MGFDNGTSSGPPPQAVTQQGRPAGMPTNNGGPVMVHPQHMSGPYGNGPPYGMPPHPPQSPHNHSLSTGGYPSSAHPPPSAVSGPQHPYHPTGHVPLHSPANMHPGMHRQMQQQQQPRKQHLPPQQQMPPHHQQPPSTMNHPRQAPPAQQQYMQHPSQQQQQATGGPPPPNSNLTGGWQSDSDIPHRREMIQQSKCKSAYIEESENTTRSACTKCSWLTYPSLPFTLQSLN
jgi:hypothetical protein